MVTVAIVDDQLLLSLKLSDRSIDDSIINNNRLDLIEATVPVVDTRKSLRSTLGLNDDDVNIDRQQQPLPQVVGHRGALYDTLENTRDGFLKCAIEYQCNAVELDVFVLPKDNNMLVVFHGNDKYQPGDLNGYCIGYNNSETITNIMDLTYDEILNLQFNTEFDEFPCPKHIITNSNIAYIPKLEDVLLDLKDTKCHVKIELKGPGVVQPVLDLVERLNMVNRCSCSSFNLTQLYELRQLRSNKNLYPTGALFEDDVPNNWYEIVSKLDANEIHMKYDKCTKSLIDNIHQSGYKTMAWLRGPIGMKMDCTTKYNDIGCNHNIEEDERCYQALIDTGVQQICCNKPNLLISMLQKQKR